MFKKVSDIIDPNLAKDARQRSSSSHSGSKQHSYELFDFLELVAKWEKIIGQKLSKVTIPIKNQYKTLTILTNHSAYSQSLSFMEKTLLEKILKEIPALRGHIKKFNFIVDSTHFDKQKSDLLKRAHIDKSEIKETKKQQTFHPQNPKYKEFRKAAEIEFSSIDDDQLREKMISIYIQSHFK